MFFYRRFALSLAVCLAAANFVLAQSSSSNAETGPLVAEGSSSSAMPAEVAGQDSTQDPKLAPPQAPPAAAGQSTPQGQGPVTVQGRIRARREQRRVQAIRDAYSHLYEAYVGGGYLRFQPGPNLQKVTYYSWDAEFTRFFNDRLGVTAGGRGYYGTPFVGINFSSITRPAVSTYAVMGGPVYRFYLQPKYSISGRVMGGWALGNFSGDTNGFGSQRLGMWKDGSTYIVSGGLMGEYNIGPGFSLRLNGEYVGTGFGSTMQNGFGFTSGFVYRFGRQ